MFQTKDDILKKRQSIKDSYTFRHIGGRDVDEKVQPRKVAEMAKIPVLDINSDVKSKLYQLENTEILTPPRFDRIEFRKELQASSKRLLKIQNGMPLSAVARESFTDKKEYQPLSPRRVNFANQKEILYPPRGYAAPGIARKSEYVLPNVSCGEESLAARAQNQLVRFKNKIYEAERQKLNETFEVLNRKNKRRPEALMQQYEDYVKYGLKESQRRADRAEQLSILKEKRSESWWPEVVDSFPKDGRSTRDLEILELLASGPKEFTEKTIGELYREALERFHNADTFKQILLKINNECNYVKDYRLLMVFKSAEKDYLESHDLTIEEAPFYIDPDDYQQKDNGIKQPPAETSEIKDDNNDKVKFPSQFLHPNQDSKNDETDEFPSAFPQIQRQISITASSKPLKPLLKKNKAPQPNFQPPLMSTASTMTDS